MVDKPCNLALFWKRWGQEERGTDGKPTLFLQDMELAYRETFDVWKKRNRIVEKWILENEKLRVTASWTAANRILDEANDESDWSWAKWAWQEPDYALWFNVGDLVRYAEQYAVVQKLVPMFRNTTIYPDGYNNSHNKNEFTLNAVVVKKMVLKFPDGRVEEISARDVESADIPTDILKLAGGCPFMKGVEQ